MDGAPDPEWYLDNVLVHAAPGGGRMITSPAARWSQWWQQRHAELSEVDYGRAACRHGFVLTTRQAATFGIRAHDIRREIRRGRWTAVMWGVFSPLAVRSDDPYVIARREHALAAAAGSLIRPGQVPSGSSAAILHGLPTMAVPERAELTGLRIDTLGRRGSAHVYGAAVTSRHLTTWFGAPVVTVARTVIDQARHDRRDGLLAAEAALFERLAGVYDIRACLDEARGWPGVRAAREIVTLASDRSESALESLTRLALHDGGLPMPRQQVEIGPYRVDFLWDEAGLVLEADGRAKSTAEELWREKRRDAHLERLGFRVVRVTWADVVHSWPQTLEHLRARLRLPR